MQSAMPSIVGVSVKVDDFQQQQPQQPQQKLQQPQQFAGYLYQIGIILHDDLAVLMLYATKVLLQKTEEMAGGSSLS